MPSSAFVPSTPLQGAMAAKANRPHSSLRASVDASQSILSHNLTQMDSSMMRVLEVESWGGNAGTVVLGGREYSCAAARGYADPKSGRILTFGNSQDVPEDRRKGYPEFVFRVAAGLQLGTHIVGCSAGKTFTDNARTMLRESMRQWNAGLSSSLQ